MLRAQDMLSILATTVCLGVSVVGGQPSATELKATLARGFAAPEWLAATSVPFSRKELLRRNKWGPLVWGDLYRDWQADSTKFKQAVATVQALMRLHPSPTDQARCHLALAIDYEAMFQDYIRAFQQFRELEKLASQAKQVHDPQNHNMRDTRRMARLGMARCLARLSLRDEARRTIRGMAFHDWRELLDLAVVDALLGDMAGSDKAIAAAIEAGRSNAWHRLPSVGRGIILLYANGKLDEAKKYLPYYDRCYKSRPQRQLPTMPPNLSGQHALVQVIAGRTHTPAKPTATRLTDGTFYGESSGCQGPVKVRVTIKAGRIADVRVVEAREIRGFNAPGYVARRIVEKQSPRVDAISGATVSSMAIMHATEQALGKAVPGARVPPRGETR